MIPLKLELQGLYSYQEPQIIDFEKLTASGLFGIFGAVGSGKSSILEGILLALYGSTERLNDRGERLSMLNLQSTECKAILEFKAGLNNRDKYQARFHISRKPRKTDELQTPTHEIYKWENGHYHATGLTAEQILGMSKAHFKQTIIIPQGKFRDFIELNPKDRADMIKDLFGLHRFELSGKSGKLLRLVKDEVIALEAQLQDLEMYNEALQAALEAELQTLKIESDSTHKKLSSAEKSLKVWEALHEKHQSWVSLKNEFGELEKLKPAMEKLRAELYMQQTALQIFKPVWENLQEAKMKVGSLSFELNNTKAQLTSTQSQIKSAQTQETTLKQKLIERPQRESRIRDLKRLVQMQMLQKQYEEALASHELLLPKLQQLQQQLKDVEAIAAENDQKLEAMQVPDANTLAEMKTLAAQYVHHSKQLEAIAHQSKQNTQQIAELEAQHKQMLSLLPKGIMNFQTWITLLEDEIQQNEKQLEQARNIAGIAAYSHLLHEGQPCPLCGAIEHPNPAKSDQIQEQIKQTEQAIETSKKQLKICLNNARLADEVSFKLDHLAKIKAQSESQQQELSHQLNILEKKITSFNILNLDDLKNLIVAQEQKILQKTELEKQTKEARLQSKNIQTMLDKVQHDISASEQNCNKLKVSIDAKQAEIEDADFTAEYANKTSAQIEATILKVEKDIEETAIQYDAALKTLNQLTSTAATLEANLQSQTKQLEEWNNKTEKWQQEWQQLLLTHKIADEQNIITILNEKTSAEEMANSLKSFDEQWLIISNKIQALEAEAGVTTFSIEAFTEQKSAFAKLKEEYENWKNKILLKNNELQQCILKVAEKAKKEKQLEKLEQRRDLIAEAHKLLDRGGFVKYISSIYLSELCHTANRRFMKLTNNRLSMHFDENDQFQVIDYLSGGKMRLLKTLSGGQTFQAALCLALSLAEKVKSISRAEQSFFFLDEGFGALDKDALRIVFETLKSLKEENRVVGIISHVEDLKQEIDVFAHIDLDVEKGSQVSYSY